MKKTITKEDWKYIEKIQEISFGSSGLVFLIKDKRNPQIQYAMKKMVAPEEEADEQNLKSEIKVLEQIMATDQSILPQGIVRYYGYIKQGGDQIQEFEEIQEDYYYLFFEPVKGKMATLMKKNLESKVQISSEIVIKFFLDTVESMLFLQLSGICHRDLKPQNILYSSQNPICFKLCDFGLSKQTRNQTFTQTYCGTKGYMAPELQKSTDKYNSFKSDMYSLGLCVLALIESRQPLSEEDRKKEENCDALDSISGPNDQKIDSIIQKMKKMFVNTPDNKTIEGLAICLKHMLSYNPTFRVDFIDLAKLMRQQKIVDFDQQVKLWKKYEQYSNLYDLGSLSQQSEEEQVYNTLLIEIEKLEKTNKQLQVNILNSMTPDEKHKSINQKQEYTQFQNKLEQLNKEYLRASEEYENVLDDLSYTKNQIDNYQNVIYNLTQNAANVADKYCIVIFYLENLIQQIQEEISRKNGILQSKDQTKQQWEEKVESIKRKNLAAQQLMKNSEIQSLFEQLKNIDKQMEEQKELKIKLSQQNSKMLNNIKAQKSDLEDLETTVKELKSKINQKQGSKESEGGRVFFHMLVEQLERDRQRERFRKMFNPFF